MDRARGLTPSTSFTFPAFYFTQSLWAHVYPLDRSEALIVTLYSLTAALLIATSSDLNYRLVETPLRKKGAAIAKRLRDRFEIDPKSPTSRT